MTPPSGLAWRNHFRRNLTEELSPRLHDPWGPGEAALLGPSLAEFQLGESSDGRHLLAYARTFGDKIGDAWLGEAMALFIQEENQHSRWLGEFLRAQGHPLLRSSWADNVFRVFRKLLGFGLMISVLVCAEIVAVPYYTAVRNRTSSLWLRTICSRLLQDEAMHLRFQAGNLAAVWRRHPWVQSLLLPHKAVMVAICLVVWRQHGAVLKQGGFPLPAFLQTCNQLLTQVHTQALAAQSASWNAAPVR